MGSEGAEVTLDIDCEVESDEINLKLADEVSGVEPCGVGNPQPTFILKGAKVTTAEAIGEGKHTKLTIDGKTALIFGVSLPEADVLEGELVDVVFRLDVNEFRGIRTEQLLVSDMRLSRPEAACISEAELLTRIENGEAFHEADGILPDRDDFAAVYKEIRGYGENGKTISLYRLSEMLGDIRGAKIKLALEILGDVGLISFETLPSFSMSGSELYRISSAKTTEKVNLFGTPRYKTVKSRMIRS